METFLGIVLTLGGFLLMGYFPWFLGAYAFIGVFAVAILLAKHFAQGPTCRAIAYRVNLFLATGRFTK